MAYSLVIAFWALFSYLSVFYTKLKDKDLVLNTDFVKYPIKISLFFLNVSLRLSNLKVRIGVGICLQFKECLMKNFVSTMIAGSALLCVNGMMSPYALAQDTRWGAC